MVELKCKMCGGNLQITDNKSYATCEYCGSTMTLPNTNDDRIVNLFNRANHYRLQNEFDKAMATYENILAEDNTNAEAHWGVILAKYGIEYVKDPKTQKRVPTCHRVQYESIVSDLDYKEAIKNAQDYNARTLYEKEATQIAEIQKNILSVARNEKPYDIFICYKETDNKGQRTRDSVFAQDIYNQLTQEKYNVFFSRITLEDKLGTEYEPYIFSALNSAKIMLVIGTTKENIEAVWVKNEWSRFLELLRKDKNRVIIPCYRDMNAYDLPEELSVFQSQDMSKIGFMQDLIHGIKKIVEQKPKEQSININNANDIYNERMSFEELLKNAREEFDNKNWINAEKYYVLLQKEYPDNIMIEAMIFIAFSRAMYNKSLDTWTNLLNCFDKIEKYYNINEDKEYVLQRISNYLIKSAFPEDKINLDFCDENYYGLFVKFNNILERLSRTHNEIYIKKLIIKQKQIIMIIKSERKNRDKKVIKKVINIFLDVIFAILIFAFFINFILKSDDAVAFFGALCLWFIFGAVPFSIFSKKFNMTWWCFWILLVICMSFEGDSPICSSIPGFLFFVFLFGILPGVIVKGIIKLLNKIFS